MAEKGVIGFMPCINCGAQVELKVNVRGYAHYACNGVADDKHRACGIVVGRFGAADTKALIDQLKGKPHDESDAAPAGAEPAAEPGEESPAEPEAGDAESDSLDGYIFERSS